jgi:hypothetical protein
LREGSRNQKINPEDMTPREKLKRRAMSVLCDFMCFDITDDEMDEVEVEVGRAALQFLIEAKRSGELIFFDLLVENYFRRCLRAADDWLFTSENEIRPGFHKVLDQVIVELQEERVLR